MTVQDESFAVYCAGEQIDGTDLAITYIYANTPNGRIRMTAEEAEDLGHKLIAAAAYDRSLYTGPTYDWADTCTLDITIHGLPAAQGSKAYKGHRTSRQTGRRVAVLVEQSKAVKPWREKVTTAAARAMILDHVGLQPIYRPVITGAIRVDITFTMPKPTSAPKRRRTYPKTRPDIDKLQRAAFDGISDAGVWEDDGRVIEVTARKTYPGEHPDALDQPGARIRLYTLGDPQ